MKTRSEALNQILTIEAPANLYHYTSPEGLLGIIKNKSIWATNVRYLNDSKELFEASDIAKELLDEIIEDRDYFDCRGLMQEMKEQVGTAASRYYVCSFSEDADSLSQWRAYCPPSGGYALGIPSYQLASLAKERGWYFVKCVYKRGLAKSIIKEVIFSFLNDFRSKTDRPNSENSKLVTETAINFQIYIAKIGGIIKNDAFQKEQEWRLISPAIVESDQLVDFRAGKSGVVPFYSFKLESDEKPDLTFVGGTSLKLTVGPNAQPNDEAILAVQYLFTRYLDISSGIIHSKIPYRSW